MTAVPPGPMQSGPLATTPVKVMAAMLTAVDEALQAEGVGIVTIERVRNRLVWGHPDGSDAVVRLTPEDQERIREQVAEWQKP